MSTARTECELKLAGDLEVGALLQSGGELLGQVVQKDYYLAGHKQLRLREEQGKFTLTEKTEDVGSAARVRDVFSMPILPREASQILKERGVLVLICKTRTLVRLPGAIVRLDEVEHLGSFVEVSAADENSLAKTIEHLGLQGRPAIKQSYRDLMIARSLPMWVQQILRFHDRVGELAFGITSGILTTAGVLVGVNSATSSRVSVIAAVVAIAVADSTSDAFGIYMAKVSERGASANLALRFALGTFAGKAILPCTFILPLLFFPLTVAVWADLVWGALALAILSAEQAVVEQQAISWRIARNLGLAIVVLVISVLAGNVVAWLSD